MFNWAYHNLCSQSPALVSDLCSLVGLQPDFSYTFRKRMRRPEAVNMGISNSRPMGGFTQGLSLRLPLSSTSHWRKHSNSPWNFLMRHMIAPCSGSYLALPTRVLELTEAVILGEGILTTTLLALRFLSQMALSFTLISSLLWVTSVQTGMILKGRLTSLVMRQDISSNTPSGGMKVIERSLSNFDSLTHWWNFMSSMVMPLSLEVTPCLRGSRCMSSLSFMPSLHSGMPLSLELSLITPLTSDLSTVPLAEKRALTFSMTSMQISFFLCTIPSGLQEVTPVAWEVNCLSFLMSFSSSSLKPPSWMQFLSRVGSVNWGQPQSITSSSISYIRLNFFLTSFQVTSPLQQALQMKMSWQRNCTAMAALRLVLVVARKMRSLQGTATQLTPFSSSTGLSLYSLVATTCEQQCWIYARVMSSLKLRQIRISPLMFMKTTELIILPCVIQMLRSIGASYKYC